MKILDKLIFTQPRFIYPKDTLVLEWGEYKVMERKVGKNAMVTGAIIFELEGGDIAGVKGGLGGAFIEEELK